MPGAHRSWADKVAHNLRENGLFYAVGFAAILGLKQYYSHAGAEELRWILAPLARLVDLLAGIQFQWDAHAGYVSHSREVIIAPACAGINFLIICFSAIFFTFLPRLTRNAAKCGWFCLCLAAAYLLTLCTNTSRILISIYLYEAPVYGSWVTPERVHRLAGTVIYVTTLVITFLAVERLLKRTRWQQPTASPKENSGNHFLPAGYPLIAVPFLWYVLVTVIVPLLNGALGRSDSPYQEHFAVILFTCLGISTLAVAIAAIKRNRVERVHKRSEKRLKIRNLDASRYRTLRNSEH